MDYPMGSARAAGKIVTREFKGLNHAAVGSEGCFADCENLSAEYPVIHTASGFFAPDTQYDSVQAVIKPHGASGFCGVAGGVLYWNGTAITYAPGSHYVPEADSDIYLYMINKYLYIYEKRSAGRVVLYEYDTAARDKKTKNYCKVCFQQYMLTFVGAHIDGAYIYGGDILAAEGDFLRGVARTSDIVNIVNSYPECVIAGPPGNEDLFMNYTKKEYEISDGTVVCTGFKDAYCGSGSTAIDRWFAQIVPTVKGGGSYTPQSGAVGGIYLKNKLMPQIAPPEIYKNRLWGGMIDGSSVIATSLGSGYDFYSFQNTAADSVELNVPAPGPFIGLKAFADALLCFKKNSITVIYGDTAYDFSVGKTIHGVGTIDIRSAAEVDGALYFCSGDGFYAYVGGQPEFISPNIRASYKACIAFSQNGKYYAEGTLADGTREMLTYDVRTGIWLREAAQGIKYVCDDEGDVLIACASGVKKHRREYDYPDNSPSWYLESQDLYESIYEKKGISEIFIRARLEKGTEMTVSTVSADGVRTKHKTFCGNGKITTYRVPVKYEKQEAYRYRISGVGAALIYDIERTLPAGGRNIGG